MLLAVIIRYLIQVSLGETIILMDESIKLVKVIQENIDDLEDALDVYQVMAEELQNNSEIFIVTFIQSMSSFCYIEEQLMQAFSTLSMNCESDKDQWRMRDLATSFNSLSEEFRSHWSSVHWKTYDNVRSKKQSEGDSDAKVADLQNIALNLLDIKSPSPSGSHGSSSLETIKKEIFKKKFSRNPQPQQSEMCLKCIIY